MFYIVGLGNPGAQYQNTRHNVGWLVLDAWLAQVGLPTLYDSAKLSGRVTEGFLYNEEVTVLYPNTFMNQSGASVQKLVPKGAEAQLIVVYDDVAIPLGEIKVSVGRGDGGHNGIKSIVSSVGTKDFIRVRVGICPKSFWTGAPKRPVGAKLPKYVLTPFTRRELGEMETVSAHVGEALKLIIEKGVSEAMNQFN